MPGINVMFPRLALSSGAEAVEVHFRCSKDDDEVALGCAGARLPLSQVHIFGRADVLFLPVGTVNAFATLFGQD
jgi:hypothetical protein